MKNVLKRSSISNLANTLDVSISTMSVDDMTSTLDIIDKESKVNKPETTTTTTMTNSKNSSHKKKKSLYAAMIDINKITGDSFASAMERFNTIAYNSQSLSTVWFEFVLFFLNVTGHGCISHASYIFFDVF